MARNNTRRLVSAAAIFIIALYSSSIDRALIASNNLRNTSISTYNNLQQPHYCEHFEEGNQTESKCYKLLFPAVASKPAWYFLGDSQMNFLIKNMEYPYEIHSTRLPDKVDQQISWGRCDLLNYYFLEPSVNWTPPATNDGGSQVQGPTKYGLTKHYCSDASGTYNRQFATSSMNFMEYISVEYASDVEHQSSITNTSQESAVHYMKWQLDNLLMPKDDAVCVVNTGIHDQRLCPGLQNEDTCRDVYVTNVKSYLHLLNSTCGYILWISITSVRGDGRQPQLNSRSIDWNERINETLASEYLSNSYFIDVWNASLHGIRNSNIHFEPPYYQSLGKLFTSLM